MPYEVSGVRELRRYILTPETFTVVSNKEIWGKRFRDQT
jgi:hypothetical protein